LTVEGSIETGELRKEILRQVNAVQDPCSLSSAFPIGLSDMGLVCDLRIAPPQGVDSTRDVSLVLRVTAPGCTYVPFMERSVKAAVGELDDVGEVSVEWRAGADWTPADMAEPVRRRLAEVREHRMRAHRTARDE
jgi:metal-sulfur cluster biosynthetic enzyme